MTDLKFVKLPGTERYVAVHQIVSWGIDPTSRKTKVRIDGLFDVTIDGTVDEFADLIALGLDGPPPKPDVPGMWRKVPEPRDCPGDRLHQHWERWFEDGSLQRVVTDNGRPPPA